MKHVKYKKGLAKLEYAKELSEALRYKQQIWKSEKEWRIIVHGAKQIKFKKETLKKIRLATKLHTERLLH